jgi:hypothetical protein
MMAWKDEDDELKTCPFCGGKARTITAGGFLVAVSCRSCSATITESTREVAVSLWNMRVDSAK